MLSLGAKKIGVLPFCLTFWNIAEPLTFLALARETLPHCEVVHLTTTIGWLELALFF
jgi:hypothetical protein